MRPRRWRSITHSGLHRNAVRGKPANRPLIFISAAEPSGDRHGASLIRAVLTLCPSARFVGVAGPCMVAAGCDRIFDMTRHAGMLLGALRALPQAAAMLTTADRHLRRYPFDAAVVIDSPTLHLPLADRAHAVGIPVLYYIAPQMWAWGAYRIYKLRHRVDRLAVILPFEESYFLAQGVDATYVGHPLAEQLAHDAFNPKMIHEIRSRGVPVMALLPGSRRHVVAEVLPGQLDVATRVATTFPGATFGVSVAGLTVAPIIERLVKASGLNIRLYPEHRAELIRAADLVLVASGTMTLEVALHMRPMIVMYNASRAFYQLIGRWLIRTPHLSLPNILAGRPIVPEFMPYYRSTTPIADRAVELLRSEPARSAMAKELAAVMEPLRRSRASERTASMLLELAGRKAHP